MASLSAEGLELFRQEGCDQLGERLHYWLKHLGFVLRAEIRPVLRWYR
jgi:hypothetical protein